MLWASTQTGSSVYLSVLGRIGSALRHLGLCSSVLNLSKTVVERQRIVEAVTHRQKTKSNRSARARLWADAADYTEVAQDRFQTDQTDSTD